MISTRLWRAFLRSRFKAPKTSLRSAKAKRRVRFHIEQLEDRIVPVTDLWTATGSGNWDVGSNWSLGVPTSTETVQISTSGNATITIKSGDNYQIPGLTTASTDTLSITGGSLEVTSGTSALSGALAMTGGTLEATGAGVSLTANSTTTVSQGSLYAESGAAISLPNLTSSVSNGTTFQAEGASSDLNLPSLATVTQAGSWSVNAYGGATVNVSALTSLTSTHGMYFEDTGGSTLNDSRLTTWNGVNFTTDGTDASVANSWTSFIDGRLEVDYGMAVTLPNLTNVNQSSLYAQNGGQLTLAGVTSYASNGTTFQAQGSDTGSGTVSLLAMPNLATVTQAGSWSVNAYGGATVNVSALTSLTSTHGMYFEDTGGSTLNDSRLTTWNGVNFTTDGTDASVANSWTSFIDGRLEVDYGMAVTLPNLTNVNQSSLYAQNGGQLTLAGVTSYASNGTTFQAQGSDTGSGTVSLLAMPNLATVTQAGNWSVNAYGGATVNVSALTSLTSTHGMYFEDTGGSTLNDSRLTTWNGVNFTTDGTDASVANPWTSFIDGRLEVDYGMAVTLPNLTNVNQSSLYAQNGGQLTLAGVTSYAS